MPSAVSAQSNPFLKHLASSDRKTRERALSSLRTYLHRPAAISPLEFLKLWKGLYYCMWMSDKPRNQQQLARDLASLVDVVAPINFLDFVEGFWKTMAVEWGNIDRLRMDKYLYLVRCYVNKGFEYVGRRDWADKELLQQYVGVLENTPLNARDLKIPNGMRYHVIDIYIDELDKVDGTRTAPLEKLLEPLKKLSGTSPTKTVRERVKEALEDERLRDWAQAEHEEEQEARSENAMAENSGTQDEVEDDDADDGFGGFGD